MVGKKRFVHITGLVVVLAAAAVFAAPARLAAPAAAATHTFGSDLLATPTLDTANGNYLNDGQQTGSEKAISPAPHGAEDTSVWNRSRSAPAGGQVLEVRIKGCAIKDATAPTDAKGNQYSQGVPANEFEFQTLSRGRGGYSVTGDAGGPSGSPFEIPWCSHTSNGTNERPRVTSGAVNTSTVRTYRPLHECIAKGGLVDFHDIGGFIESNTAGEPSSGGPWYAQGIPFEIIAAVKGSSLNSFVGIATSYGPPNGSSETGYGAEAGEELMMQVIMGTGGDAYGVCPGGKANEPATSNRVICTYGKALAGYDECNATGQPIAGSGKKAKKSTQQRTATTTAIAAARIVALALRLGFKPTQFSDLSPATTTGGGSAESPRTVPVSR